MTTSGHDLDAVLAQAEAWRAADLRVAIATVVRTWGSSPRPAGSKLAVNQDGSFVGSVSGGCIEAAVIGEALDVMTTGAVRVLTFGVSDETAWEVGLACGGTVEVYVEAVAAPSGRGMTRALLAALIAARQARTPVVLMTALAGDDPRLAGDDQRLVAVGAEVAAALAPGLADAVARDQAVVVDTAAGPILIEPLLAPLRLIVVGAVHVAHPLAQLAAVVGYAVTIIDPRRAFATAVRFPDVALVTGWPDAALTALGPDARTAVVTLTHDPKLDDPALVVALTSPAFYVGCLGSTKTHAARRTRLAAAGVDAAALDRLHGPVGLRLGARTPAEIAVSILAEIIAAHRGGAAARPGGSAA